jgi:serine/threonine protein kinase
MPPLDAATVAQRAVKLGLATQAQVEECRDELGNDADRPSALLDALERKQYLTRWQREKLLKGDSDGYLLGGYRLLYKIASGSFGRVFRADDPRSGNVVAIKVLRRRWSDNPHNVELFEREAKLGMGLNHPNIVAILAVSRDPASKQYFIVMEFVEGGNLREIMKSRKRFDPADALRIMDDAVAGLTYAFSRRFTHRDIKLTNILISAQGVAKLVDFGLAGMVAPQGFGREEESENVDRTVDYAGLERATSVETGDVRSDIYFLGCVLYEMLTGRSPILITKDKHARMARQRFEKVPPLRPEEVNAPQEVFAALVRLVETMMSLDPKRRYQTPAQLLQAVRDARKVAECQADNTQARERSVYIVENNLRLQENLRQKLREIGYRVFIASDPRAALTRYRQLPFDAMIIDVGAVGEDGLTVFQQIQSEALRQNLPCAGIIVLAEEQADWAEKVTPHPKVAVMVRPVTLKGLSRKLQQLMPLDGAAGAT